MNAENNTVSKNTISFGLSLTTCSILNALLVVAKEKSPAVQAVMKHLTGHHWTAQVAIILILFALLAWLIGRCNKAIPVNRLIKAIVAGVLGGGLMIVGFYLIAG